MKKYKWFWFIWGLAIISSILFARPAQATAPDIEIKIPKNIQGTIKEYAYDKVVRYWGESHWKSFDKLIEKESSWNPLATNTESTALGLGQLLLGTYKSVGCKQTFNPDKQIDCAIIYISERYGDPKKALAFHLQNNYY